MGLQSFWGPLVAWYLFLAGTGAGAYTVAVIADHCGGKYKAIARTGVFLGAPLVAIGSMLLLLELGNPARFMFGFLNPQSSMMSIGIFIISVFMVLGVIHIILFFVKKEPGKISLLLGKINIVFSLGTACYTGLLLGVAQAIPFWNSPVLPALFLLSCLSTGIGAIFLIVGVWRWLKPASVNEREGELTRSSHFLSRIDIPIVVLELLTLFFLLYIMSSAQGVASVSAQYLISGDYALALWLGVVVVGLLVPLTVEAFALIKGKGMGYARLSDLGVVAGLCLLFGGIVLRYAILSAGMVINVTLF